MQSVCKRLVLWVICLAVGVVVFLQESMLGMLFVVSDVLKMCVRALMACGPRCFRCKYDKPSEPVEDLFFVLQMACSVMFVVNSVSMFVCSML